MFLPQGESQIWSSTSPDGPNAHRRRGVAIRANAVFQMRWKCDTDATTSPLRDRRSREEKEVERER